MHSNQASEVDEVYYLRDISDFNPSSMENYMTSAKTCIDYDRFDPDLPVSDNSHKRKDRSMHLKSSQRPCKIADYRQKKGPADITKSADICNEEKQEEIVHVRAKRGQATNSHSLAERVRREKIGERMRFLQDLVPGCNKITGKAMMLDEIINYVQSLQHQIEFLSMKLAALCPEANVDLEQIFSRDMVFPSNFSASSLGLVPSSRNTSSNLYGLTPQAVAASNNTVQLEKPYSATTPQIPGSWDFDLQSMIQMGFLQPETIDNSDSIKMD